MQQFSKNPNKAGDSDYTDDELGIDETEDIIIPNNENDMSDSESSDIEMSESEDDSDFVPDSDLDSEDSTTNIQSASTSRAGTSAEINALSNRQNDDDNDDDTDDEDDETIKAIKNAIRKPKMHPPEIKTPDFVTDLSFHPSEDILALGTIVGDILLYKYANDGNELIKSLEVHMKPCRSVEFDDEGETILSASKDKSVMLTDVETGKLKQFYDKAHNEPIYKLYVIDENLFSTGDEAGTVKLWDRRQKEPIFSLKEVEDFISSMLTNDAKKLLLFTSGDGYLTTINLVARKLFVQSEPYDEELNCMGLYRNDSKVIVGSSKGKIYSFNWGQFGYHSDMYPGVKAPIECMIPITDRIACLSGEEGILRATHITPFKNLGVVGQHKLAVESMDINHSGEFIASCSHNEDVFFWNIKYFEDFHDIKFNVKHNERKDRKHNLPSSKVSNASDFFADLAN